MPPSPPATAEPLRGVSALAEPPRAVATSDLAMDAEVAAGTQTHGPFLVGGSDGELQARLCRATLRANPAFDVVAHEELAPGQRQRLAGLTDRPDHHGVLVSRTHPHLGVHAIDRDGAAFLRSLGRPASLDEVAAAGRSPVDVARVAALVLDGVLQVATDRGFVCGPRAHEAVFGQLTPPPPPTSVVGARSEAALQAAQHLPIDDPQRLTSWLYAANTVPIGPRWARALRDRASVRRELGLGSQSATRAALDAAFVHQETPEWSSWRWAGPEGDDLAAVVPSYKLYVSAAPGSLRGLWPQLVRTLVDHRVPAFKSGHDVYGLLRPDKLMVYFHDVDDLHRFAAALSAALDGAEEEVVAQGVPFTAPIDGRGLLSWGVDPPRALRIRGLRGSESWRVWVAARLARALLSARAEDPGSDLPAWRYAMARITLDGVDPHRWLPAPTLWSGTDRSASR